MKNLRKRLSYGLYIMLCFCFISSCSVESYEWEKGCEICKEHDGVRYIHVDAIVVKVRCNDGHSESIK